MATDATGTPTAKGIPKYDPANDAPSGLGFNAAMDAIDIALGKAQHSTDTQATDEVAVWNGTAWIYQKIDAVTGLLNAANVNYTPVWTSSGTAPVIGNGTLSGSYVRIGSLVFVSIALVFGTTTTGGTGEWRFGYGGGLDSNVTISVGSGWAIDGSVPASHSLNVRGESTYITVMNTAAGPATLVSATTPFTWANTDILRISLTYMRL